jgi:hypothetical protein
MGLDLSNVILPAVVSVVVSAIVSYLLGPRMAVRQEAAKDDADVRTELQRIIREIVRLLEYEEMNRKDLINGMTVPSNKFLEIWSLDEPFWRLIRTADNPRLDRRTRERLYEQLKRIIPLRFEILRVLPQAPKPEDYSLDRLDSLTTRLFVEGLERLRQGQKYEDKVDVLAHGKDAQDALDKLRELIGDLEKIEQLLEKKGALGKLADRVRPVSDRFSRKRHTRAAIAGTMPMTALSITHIRGADVLIKEAPQYARPDEWASGQRGDASEHLKDG